MRTSLLLLLVAAIGWPGAAHAQLARHVYASGFSAPVGFVQDPTDTSVQFVVEQGGRIRRVVNGTVTGTFLDLSGSISSGGERGLLGLAFAPDYATSRRFYVNFTNPDGHTVIARFNAAASGLVADPATRRNLRWDAAGTEFIAQPFANHNGGNLVFGPDGYLYIGMGDGGSGDDPGHLAQNPASLLGKMLRIDVNVPDGDFFRYRIPPGNPFVSNPSIRPEIWAFGLRNPWRYSFDDPARGGTGALVIGDVGQNAFEEVDYQPAAAGGINWGWRNREGAHDHIAAPPPAYAPLTDPIYEYSHASGGVSITGGFVYRGAASAYRGRYFFADLTGAVWSLGLTIDQATGRAQVVNVTEHTSELGPKVTISSFGVDAGGRLYIVDYGNGRILAMDFPTSAPADMDGDNRADPVVWRPGPGVFYALPSRSGYATTAASAVALGTTGDVPFLGDMDGDGRRDVVVWRPATGTWKWLNSSTGFAAGGSRQWGNQGLGDQPILGDIDGDGRSALIVWRASSGTWWWLTSSSGYAYGSAGNKQWGNNSVGDQPRLGDFDGDGRVDLTVWRPGTGTWHFLRSSSSYDYATAGATQWGNQSLGDLPRVGDFDADGISDFAVWRPASGTWFYLSSSERWSTASARAVQWGNASLGDQPFLADMDADGKSDFVVWRPSNGTWYWLTSATGYNPTRSGGVQWGNNSLGDMPVVK